MKGRIPKPREVKENQGTLQKCREPTDYPKYESLSEYPDAPASLEGAGLDKWISTAPMLVDQRVLKAPDLDALEAYCIAYENMAEAQRMLRGNFVTQGSQGQDMKNPLANVLKESMAEVRHFGSLLGLNPASRGRLSTGNESEKEAKAQGFGDRRPLTGADRPKPFSVV